MTYVFLTYFFWGICTHANCTSTCLHQHQALPSRPRLLLFDARPDAVDRLLAANTAATRRASSYWEEHFNKKKVRDSHCDCKGWHRSEDFLQHFLGFDQTSFWFWGTPKRGSNRQVLVNEQYQRVATCCNRKLGDLLRRQLLGGFLPFPCSSLPRWMIPTTFQFFRVQTTNRSETPLSREFCMWLAQDSTLNQPRLGGSGGRVWHDSSLFTRWRGGETHRAGHGLLFATRTETRRSLQWRRYLAICAIDSCPSSTTFWQIIYMRPEMPKPFSNLGKRQSKEGGSNSIVFCLFQLYSHSPNIQYHPHGLLRSFKWIDPIHNQGWGVFNVRGNGFRITRGWQ